MDGTNVPQTWLNGLLAALIAVCGFVMRLYKKRLEDLEAKIEKFATREELAAVVEAHEKRVERMHEDNTGNFRLLAENLRDMNANINNKLFELARQKQP